MLLHVIGGLTPSLPNQKSWLRVWVKDIYFSEINECTTTTTANQHNCHQNATCFNTPGSFFCFCDVSFIGDGVATSVETALGCYGTCWLRQYNDVICFPFFISIRSLSAFSKELWGQLLEIKPPHFTVFHHLHHFALVKFQAIPSKFLNIIGPSSFRSFNCFFFFLPCALASKACFKSLF